MKTWLAACAVALLPGTALAASASEVKDVALTVYNGDLALIKEVRDLSLDSGTQVVTLENVSGQLRPETVHLDTPGNLGVQILEQNYDYDLVSTDKLLERFIGKQITLVNDANNTVIMGTLLSVVGGLVIQSEGQILLNPPGRVVLPAGAADNLLLRPTLSWRLSSPQAGPTRGEVSYLSGGLNWNADYVLMLEANDRSAGLEGWVTLSNYSGTTYNDAALKLVAGDVNRVKQEMDMMMRGGAVAEAMPAPAPAFVEQQFFEYHLYDLQRRTTIRNNQQKQIGLLSAQGVPVTKIYTFDGQGGDNKVHVTVELENSEEHNLGMPLPAGVVRLYKKDASGAPQFVGEDRIQHTPRKEKLRLNVGNAFDLAGTATQMDYKDLGNGYEQSWKVELRNRKENEAVTIRVASNFGGDWEITQSNFDYVKKNANQAEWNIPVPADSVVELNYTVRVIWEPRPLPVER
jgi:hypothetical protein